MNTETRECKNCKQSFVIEPDDFAFYEKIKVPPPAFCSECRLKRRLAFTNERVLYKRKCDLCSREVVSSYAAGTPFPVYCVPCYDSDKWDSFGYGRDVDFARSFWEQFLELKQRVPRRALVQQGENVNSEYTHRASNNKNCYLVFRAAFNENCAYSHYMYYSKECLDCLDVNHLELSYECVNCIYSYGLHYCQECQDCRESYFLYDCRNCTDCFGCVGLRSKQYHIFNEPYLKEDYFKKLKEFRLDDFGSVEKIKKDFERFAAGFIRIYMQKRHGADISGNWLGDCKNVHQSFSCMNVEDAKYAISLGNVKDSMDYYCWGIECETVYESVNVGYNSSRIFFSNECWVGCSDLEYCDNCSSSHDLFGCVGIKRGSFSILNRRYEEKEYKALVPEIKQLMDAMPYVDKKGKAYRYGEFPSVEFASWAYNETVAQEHFPLTREKVEAEGYEWRDPKERSYAVTKSVKSLPNIIHDVAESILGEIIECAHGGRCTHECSTGFKLTGMELQFYKRAGIPLPRLCYNCRHRERFLKRTPWKLWHRQCMCNYKVYQNSAKHSHHPDGRCPNEFETSYAPDRPEIVYCEQCYNAEVV